VKYIIVFLLWGCSMCSFVHDASTHSRAHPVLVFDFGGVIGGADLDLVAEQTATALGLSVSEALDVIGQSREAKKNGIAMELFWQDYERRSGKALPLNWSEQFVEIKRLSIRSRPEMLELVDHLRECGYRVALFSNTTVPRAAFIRALGVYDHFDPVVLSCDIGVAKPHPRAFKVLMDTLGVASEACLFIDNDAENVAAARRCGMECIAFESPAQLRTDMNQRGILQ
jgi:putative hydrolase of the HAD superfamily